MDDRRQLERWLSRHVMPGPESTRDDRAEFFASMPQNVRREWDLRSARNNCERPDHNAALSERAQKRMARVDAMPPDLRAVVYEYGLEVVQEFINCGVKIPSRIKHLIDTVLHNELPNGQARFKINKGPNAKRNPAEFEDEYWAAK